MAKSHPSQRVTIDDVSRLAQVSTATVSRVINRSAVVAEETVSRVMAAIEEINYVPNSSARVLAGGKTSTIGLVVPEIGARSLLTLLTGIETGAQENGYHLLIYSTGQRTITSQELLKALGPHNSDGLLVYVNSLDEKGLQRLHSIGFPIVLLHQVPPKELTVPYVTFQNKPAVKELVDHLIEVHGCQRIAFLRGPEGHDDSHSREQGYLDSLKAHGIPSEPELIGYGGFNPRDAEKTVTSWIAAGLHFDAIFSGDDMAALGAIHALQKAGVRVPEDVAVVGFDDIDFGYNISPPLTTICADFQEAGFQATVALIKLIRKVKAKSRILLPTKLVIRQSCGCRSS
jgi:LacI family transcriptional regulator